MSESYLWEFLNAEDDFIIVDSFVKANSVINNPFNKNILCSISGGSDSDVMLDLVSRVDKDNKVKYVWFDTGLEYQATKDHLKELEKKYNISIIRRKAIKPIPSCCKEYGQPFLSKTVSEMIERLQRHGFKWEDKPFNELVKKYPNCVSALKWWCNCKNGDGNESMFNITRNKYLKEFMIENPPTFKISNKCCKYAKKEVATKLNAEFDADLHIVGVRKAEGGARATAYKNCYTIKDNEASQYRPIFWYSNDSKEAYEKKFDIKHSECYTKYGFPRTGCCCCPYSRNLETELETTRIYEPNLYKAVSNVFKDSYQYTKEYRQFVQTMKSKEIMDKNIDQLNGQMNIYDFTEVTK